MVREKRRKREQDTYCLVLSRSCADLYEEIAELFADRPYIKVVVDRREGKDGMTEIPAGKKRGARTRKGQANPRVVSVRFRKEAS
jgi:hypothetical protein